MLVVCTVDGIAKGSDRIVIKCQKTLLSMCPILVSNLTVGYILNIDNM